MEIILILLSSALTIVGILISVKDNKNKKKVRWLGTSSFLLVIAILFTQLLLQYNNAKNKDFEKQEFLKIKYDKTLNDDDIKNKIKSFINNGKIDMSISPNNEAFGKSAVMNFFLLPSPKTLKLKYKVIDPSNYGLQGITPLLPIISHIDGKKYYFGAVTIPVENLNGSPKIIVVTKYVNGIYDVESIEIKKYFVKDIASLSFSVFDE